MNHRSNHRVQYHRNFTANDFSPAPPSQLLYPQSTNIVKHQSLPLWFSPTPTTTARQNAANIAFLHQQTHPQTNQMPLTSSHQLQISVPRQAPRQIQPRDDEQTRKHTSRPRAPHLPAEKSAALMAAKMAADCPDPGPDIADRFKCSFEGCEMAFSRRYNLKVHMRKHTKETPYSCTKPGCGKKFKWRSSMAHHAKSHNGVRPSPKAPLPIRKSSTNVDLRISQRVIDQQIVPAISRVSLFESRLSDRCARSDREAYRFLGTGTGHTLPTSPVSSENVEHATHAVDADYVHHGHAMAELRSPFTPSNNMEVNDEEFGFSSENISGDTILDNLMDPGHMDSNNC